MAGLLAGPARADDVNEATERALKAAAAQVAPAVVKIETAGGAEVIPAGKKKGPGGGVLRKGLGPTTGLIVSADGYIITSSFNFVHKPTDIFVSVPGRPNRFVAKIVGQDQTRMLTLLKIDAADLPVPQPVPKSAIEVGQWAVALGRAVDPAIDHPPAMSIGIISALNRIWGKAIQTDAKTSPVNYGGPLVAIDGRVYGVIVPMSNRAEDETAGVEIYDSGIGFAVPLEDILRVLPRLKTLPEGQSLKRGLLGITPQGNDLYGGPPAIGSVLPDSAAARAGLQPGDVILEINGRPVPHYTALQHILGPLYEGDVVSLKIRRGDKELTFPRIELLGSSPAFVRPFLGILPLRDDPGPGVPIRYVYPNSPAAQGGIRPGDRILKIGPADAKVLAPVANLQNLQSLLSRFPAYAEIVLEIESAAADKPEPPKEKDPAADPAKGPAKEPAKEPKGAPPKTRTVRLKLAAMPDELPTDIPLPSSAGRALERPKTPAPPKGILPPKGVIPPKIVPPGKVPPGEVPPPREIVPGGSGGSSSPGLAPFGEDLAAEPSLGLVEAQDPPADPSSQSDPKGGGIPPTPKVETGLIQRVNEGLGREYWLFVPENYNPNVSHGLIVWFHDRGTGRDGERLSRLYRDFCEQHHFILLGPKSGSRDGVWLPSETELVLQDVRAVLGQYTIDRNRIVAHGMGTGGQMAFYVGFNARDLFRGVAAVGAALGTNPKDNLPDQPLSFFIAAGDKDPSLPEIKEGVQLLRDRRFPVIFLEMQDSGREYLDEAAFAKFLLWLDSLDRL